VLRDIYRRLAGKVGLNAGVVRAGEVAVGDPVELLA
jgi:MOSC domain-containing protein YiiM